MSKKTVPSKKSKTIKETPKKTSAITKQMGSLEKFRRMATVIQDSNDAITFQDLEGNILAWNQGAEIIYGYSQEEALEMNIVDTVPSEYQEEARAFLSSLKRGELVPNLETKRKHKDGRIIDVWLTNTKLTDDKGKLTGIATTERDISEQTKTLEKFRRMATVIQDSNDAITFQDLEGNILAWNRGAEVIYGYSEAEALKMNIVDTVPKEYQEEALGFLASLKRGELLPNLETKRKTKDGRIVEVWLTNTKLTDDKGNLTGIATTERDISERKQTEVILREKFRELEYLREGQIALSEKMRGEQVLPSLAKSILSHLVLFTNAQVAAFYWVSEHNKLQQVSSYALSKSEGIQKTLHFGEGLIGEVALEKKSLLVENVPDTYFNKIKSHLGEMVPKSLLICPILYEGEVNAVIELGSFNSFTEHQRAFLSHVSENIGVAINTSVVRKKVQHLLEQSQTDNEELHARQEELRVSNEELEEQTQALEQQKNILNEKNSALNKAQTLLEEKAREIQRASQYKTEFLANMSHELRTPLNSTLILSKLLMDNAKGNLSPEQIEFAESIYSSGNDLLNLINDILDLSKVEAGKLDIRVENVIISKMIDEMKVSFLQQAREKKIDFQIQLELDLPNYIASDKQRLDQILKNLLSNAFKFTSAGLVQFRLYKVLEDKIAFEVLDTGIGIPKEQHETIFEAFRQADGNTTRKYGGSGLGLSISKDLARLLGGTIQVESAPGQGSKFTLIIPRKLNEESAPISVMAFSPTLPYTDDRLDSMKSPHMILVIEEEAKFSKILFDLAHELNYTCIVAQGADEGLKMALEYNPEAILLDMKLPETKGLTIMERLKESPLTKNIPVHVISSEDYTEEYLDKGAVGYVLKPVTRERIKEIFGNLEEKFSQKIQRVLILEDDKIQRESISHLISDEGIKTTLVGLATDALAELKTTVFDCMIMDLGLPGMDGFELLEKLALEDSYSFPPIIVYTGRDLSREEEDKLRKYSKSIIIKGAKSSERLLDEVTLFLHRVGENMSSKRRQMLKLARSREQLFEGRKILLVDDDVRNIFALSSALEQRGATIIIGRNGQEALNQLEIDPGIDLVLMDIMMPEMDGFEATRRIRTQKRFAKLPIIAVTAKAMQDDQEKCMEAGTNDFLAKPVDLDKLLSLMRVWMPKLGRFHA